MEFFSAQHCSAVSITLFLYSSWCGGLFLGQDTHIRAYDD